jgi:hypothetical protein
VSPNPKRSFAFERRTVKAFQEKGAINFRQTGDGTSAT